MIVKLLSIEQISHQKISEILELFLGVKIHRQRVYDLFNKVIDGYLSMSIRELQKKIVAVKLNLVGLFIMMRNFYGSNINHMSA